MKPLPFIFFLHLVLLLSSCQQKPENNTEAQNIAPIDQAAETENNHTNVEEGSGAVAEEASEAETEASIVAFYNKILERLYPNRTLSAQYQSHPIAVSANALEDVEGGGLSTKYLRVVNEVDIEIGAIIYEASTPYPITLSIAVLEKENILVSSTLTDINGRTVLRISSNKNGNPDLGPYDYHYFTYDEFINLQPVLTKTMVDAEPDLSPSDGARALKNITNRAANFSKEKMIALFKGYFLSRDFDAMKYQPIMDSLQGIDQYYVRNNLLRLHSLLKYYNDERYKALENDLKGKEEYPAFIHISIVDNTNGYIQFQTELTDCENTLVYWVKKNGDRLIGHAQKCCTMFCEGDIAFTIYSPNTQTYAAIPTKEVIKAIETLKAKKPEGHIAGDGYNYEFILPKKGKNIRHCVEKDCINLIWRDGTFSVEE